MSDTSFIKLTSDDEIYVRQGNVTDIYITQDLIVKLDSDDGEAYESMEKLSDDLGVINKLDKWIITDTKLHKEFIGKTLEELCKHLNKEEELVEEKAELVEEISIKDESVESLNSGEDTSTKLLNKTSEIVLDTMKELNKEIDELEKDNLLSKSDITKVRQAYTRAKAITYAIMENSEQVRDNLDSLSGELSSKLVEIREEIGQISKVIGILTVKLENILLNKKSDSQSNKDDTEVVRLELKPEERFDKIVKLENGITFNTLKKLMKVKGAILIKGAPGSGKTTAMEYFAKEIVASENGNKEQIMFVQFSSSYSYTHIIDGIMPNKENGSWEIKEGTLKKLCNKALKNPDKQYFYLIDEINRADTENVVGELLNCIERRGKEIVTKSGNILIIPKNVCIIATMNEFDSGTKKLDSATLSRFAIVNMTTVDMDAEFILRKTGVWDKASDKLKEAVDWLIIWLGDINKQLEKSEYLGKENCIGMRDLFTSYENISELKEVVKYCILENINRNKKTLSDECIAEVEKITGNIKNYFNIK